MVGLLIPFCILAFAKNRQRQGLVVFSSVLVVAGVFFKRVWLLLTSFSHFNVPVLRVCRWELLMPSREVPTCGAGWYLRSYLVEVVVVLALWHWGFGVRGADAYADADE